MAMRKKLVFIAACLLITLGAAADRASAFTISLSTSSFPAAGITPVFSNVRSFLFEIDFAGTLVAGASYDNSSLLEVRYDVRGGLSTSPPTPSGFPGFALNRTATGEGVISAADWIGQGSSIAFEVAASANLFDGLQLSELDADPAGLLVEIDAREFERLDRARYHPPQLLLYADGTGILRNSNNSSGSTDTVNPATGLKVNVDFGEEYITNLAFSPSEITLAVPQPGTALLLAAGLVALAVRKRGEDRREQGQRQPRRGGHRGRGVLVAV
jgi:hypothetical protein